jgi:hypothetical protein
MAFFRQYIAPLLIFGLFFVTLIVVSARAFLRKLPDTDRFSGTVRALSSPEPVMLHKRAKQTRASRLVYHSPQKRNHTR